MPGLRIVSIRVRDAISAIRLASRFSATDWWPRRWISTATRSCGPALPTACRSWKSMAKCDSAGASRRRCCAVS